MQGPIGLAGYTSGWSGEGRVGYGVGGEGEGGGGGHRQGSTGRASKGAPGTHGVVGGRGGISDSTASEEALNSPHQRVQGRASVALPEILVLVGGASIEEGAGGSLVHGPELSMKRGKGAAPRDHFHHALPGPCGECGAQRNLGSCVALPTGVIQPTRVLKGEPGLGHDHAALRHRGRNRVEGAETPVPDRRGHVDRHDVPTRRLLEADVVR
jgi:hypothetical protein